METLVSVCLPVFNGAKFLRSAIESVLAQTHQNFELLISDDCSTDDSLSVILEFAKQDSRVRYWRNETRLGLFSNYNATIAQARGSFIKPFAQDDLWNSRIIERSLKVLQENPNVELVSTRRIMVDEAGVLMAMEYRINTVIEVFGESMFYSGNDVISACLEPLQNIIGEPCTVMFRKGSVGEGFATQFRHLGDLEYWIRILANGDYAFIDEPLAYFRKHPGSTTTANNMQLWIASDIAHFSHACEPALRKIGKSRHSFVQHTLHWLSCELSRLIEKGEVSEDDLHKDPLLRREDLDGLKEALYNSMLVISDLSSSSPSTSTFNSPVDQVSVLRRQLKMRNMEAKLRRALDSPSWRATRMLREVNRIFGNSVEQHFSSGGKELDSQDEYIQSLRETLRRIFNSRSWKLARSFRRTWNYSGAKSRNKISAELS